MVPREEIESRLAAFREALGRAGLEGAVIVESSDLYYLTGTSQSAHLVVPTGGEPVLLVRRSLERARRESPLERVEPFGSLRDLGPALAAAGLAGGRLGFELDVLPAARYLDYARRLDGFELADCSAELRRLRAVKSPWELERVRLASAMLAGVLDLVAGVLREGMTELELSAEIEAWLRRQGHQGLLRMRAFNGEIYFGLVAAGEAAAEPGGSDTPLVGRGPNTCIAKGSSPRPIGRGEPIVLDLMGAWEGYTSDQTRTISLGPLPERFRAAYETAREILRAVAAAARPGVAGSHLYELSLELAGPYRDAFASAGPGRVSFVGHGLGLEIDEPPYLARGFEEPLRPGMVFACEPKFVWPGEGAVGIENTYAVTEDGVEQLTSAPEELLELQG